MRPDRTIARALRRIDPLLEIRWVPRIERWGVYHDLPFREDLQRLIEQNAVELQVDLVRRGYLCTRQVCEEMVWLQTQERYLVCYVVEDDGGFRPLDGRIMEKLKRMDQLRQNWDVQDWKTYMTVKARLAQEQRERAQDDYYAQVRRCGITQQFLRDAVQGTPPLRSVYVEQPDQPSRMAGVVEPAE